MQVTLKLLTDIEPGGQGNDVSALMDRAALGPSGKQWQFTGNRGLLKSALQKNVRLGRASAAVRSAHEGSV